MDRPTNRSMIMNILPLRPGAGFDFSWVLSWDLSGLSFVHLPPPPIGIPITTNHRLGSFRCSFIVFPWFLISVAPEVVQVRIQWWWWSGGAADSGPGHHYRQRVSLFITFWRFSTKFSTLTSRKESKKCLWLPFLITWQRINRYSTDLLSIKFYSKSSGHIINYLIIREEERATDF